MGAKLSKVGRRVKVIINEIISPNVIIQPKSIIGLISLKIKDKNAITEKYNEIAHRDAQIISDSIYDFDENSINVYLKISEGNPYFIRDIKWSGNQKYSSGLLDTS